MYKAKVVVVGAGASGIAATARLMENGVEDVVVLEAEERIGGRIHSVPFGNDVLDLGAHWVHGEVGNVVYSMASEHNLLTDAYTGFLKTPFIVSSGKVVDRDISDKIITILSIIQYDSESELKKFNGSLGEFFIKEYKTKISEEFGTHHSNLSSYFLDWFQKYENSIEGSDSWFETSGRGLTEYWDCDGNLLLAWKSGGYQKIFDVLMNKYPGKRKEVGVPSKVLFNKDVTSINWKNISNPDRGSIIVECTDGSSFEADHVILTVSLGVLKEKVNSMFFPTLSSKKINAIKGLGIGTVNKIYLRFPYRWWPEDCSGFSLLWTEEDAKTFKPSGDTGEGINGKHWLQDVFGFYYVLNQPLVLCGWIVGPPARYMESLSDEQVLQGCYELLQTFAGRGLNVSVPKPDYVLRTKWTSNPHFRGSYSFRSMESESRGAFASHLAEPVTDRYGKPVLMFAGEATHDHYYSTVHGAVETGWREAERILNYYGCRKSSL